MNKALKLFFLAFLVWVLFFLANQLSLQDLNFISQNSEEKLTAIFPLIKEGEINNLSRSGVLKWTNYERNLNGLTSLSENETLNRIAEKKIEDMFKNQYFEHISPSGEKIDDLVNLYEYKYIGIGENLAMGGFKDDEDLVTGWMNSPGHRANILNLGFSEIGIAAQMGVFQGSETWFAVQVFGLPSSACPGSDTSLYNLINQKKEDSNNLYLVIIEMKEIIEKSRIKNSSEIKKYNNLILEYNNLINQIELLTEEYNKQVNDTNKCINSYGF